MPRPRRVNIPAIDVISPEYNDPNDSVLCPWFSATEWEDVYSWLYSSNPDLVEKGLARVAAWEARAPAKLPIVVEITAGLVECQLTERKTKTCAFHGLCLGYSMAVTRFINGVCEITHARGLGEYDIKTSVYQYGVPSWVVTVRHQGTHALLPSLGELHAAAEFALSWLRANYWRPQRKILLQPRVKSRSATPITSLGTTERTSSEAKRPLNSGPRDSAIAKLTLGLCYNRPELTDLLTGASYKELSEYINKGQLLQLPSTVKMTIRVPDTSDLEGFPTLTIGDLGLWKKHLLKAAEKDGSFKQKLTSALIVATHSTDDVSKRDYLASWLGVLMVEHYEVEMSDQSRMEVVTIVDDGDQFLPGSLDWLQLFKVSKDHPGYYTHAVSSLVDGHLRSVVAESIREKSLYLSRLVTLSERLAPSLPGTTPAGQHMQELQTRLKRTRKSVNQIVGPPKKRSRLSNHSKWKVVSNVLPWIRSPLGVCPNQTVTSTFLDLPTSVNKQERTRQPGKRSPSKSKIEVSGDNDDELKPTLESVQVKLF